MLGGSAWLSIPLGFAGTMGLACIVLTNDPSFPGFPAPLSAAQVGAGLPAYVSFSHHFPSVQILMSCSAIDPQRQQR